MAKTKRSTILLMIVLLALLAGCADAHASNANRRIYDLEMQVRDLKLQVFEFEHFIDAVLDNQDMMATTFYELRDSRPEPCASMEAHLKYHDIIYRLGLMADEANRNKEE